MELMNFSKKEDLMKMFQNIEEDFMGKDLWDNEVDDTLASEGVSSFEELMEVNIRSARKLVNLGYNLLIKIHRLQQLINMVLKDPEYEYDEVGIPWDIVEADPELLIDVSTEEGRRQYAILYHMQGYANEGLMEWDDIAFIEEYVDLFDWRLE